MTLRRADAALVLLGALLGALVVVPLALNPFLPFEDLPNHIARRYLSSAPGEALGSYFTFDDRLSTNAAVDLAWRLLAPLSGDAVGFSHWALGFAMLGFVMSVAALHRVLHGHWSAWPMAAALLVYNANMLWGFENFVVTAPFGILGLALWVGTRDRAPMLRLCLTMAVVAVLYLGHVLVLLAYALLVFGYEAGRSLRQGRMVLRGVNWLGLAVVLAACLAHVMLTSAEPAPGYGTATRFGSLAERLHLLAAPFGSLWAGALLQALGWQGPLILACLLLLLVAGRRIGLSVRLAPGMQAPLLVLGAATLLMPVQLSGVYFTHLRFPFILLGVAIAATDPRVARPWLKGVLTLALVALVAVRAFVLDRAAQAYSAEVAAIVTLAANLPAGARVLPVMTPEASGATTLHFHTAAYLVPTAEVFVPTLFVGGSHALGIAPQWQTLTAPQPSVAPVQLLDISADLWTEEMVERWAFARVWRANFTHLLVLGRLSARAEATLPIRRLGEARGYVLYAIAPDETQSRIYAAPAATRP